MTLPKFSFDSTKFNSEDQSWLKLEWSLRTMKMEVLQWILLSKFSNHSTKKWWVDRDCLLLVSLLKINKFIFHSKYSRFASIKINLITITRWPFGKQKLISAELFMEFEVRLLQKFSSRMHWMQAAENWYVQFQQEIITLQICSSQTSICLHFQVSCFLMVKSSTHSSAQSKASWKIRKNTWGCTTMHFLVGHTVVTCSTRLFDVVTKKKEQG